MKLSNKDQIPIDKLVEEQTVARLIIKNSLNDKLRAHLITVIATDDDCYPNSINDALSLISTFAKTKKELAAEDAVVSYHVAADVPDDINDVDITIDDDNETNSSPDNVIDDNNHITDDVVDTEEDLNEEPHGNRVSFSATVMAAVINEATTDADADRFLRPSFAELQDVDDVNDDNEPDVVCCAHVIDTFGDYELDDEGDEPQFVMMLMTKPNCRMKEFEQTVRPSLAILIP
jgi:hypothetical protein